MNVQWNGTNGGMDSTVGGDTRRDDLQWERIHGGMDCTVEETHGGMDYTEG